MSTQVIHKPESPAVAPNLLDYVQTARTFRWEQARAELDGLPGGKGLNIAHEAVDRHARGRLADKVALRCIGRANEAGTTAVKAWTYAQLSAMSNRFANVLRTLGVGKGDRVFALMPRVSALYFAALGTLKNLSVFSPLFSAFGPEPIKTRMTIGAGKVLVTTAALYRRKVAQIRTEMPDLEHVLLVDQDPPPVSGVGVRPLWPLLSSARSRPPTRKTRRCCTSPAAPRASRKARSTCTPPSRRIT
jgi:acetyl-CoA synthetase